MLHLLWELARHRKAMQTHLAVHLLPTFHGIAYQLVILQALAYDHSLFKIVPCLQRGQGGSGQGRAR